MTPDWLVEAAARSAAGEPFVLVTLTEVTGHAPREAGAKMIVGPDWLWGTVGGGNVELTAVDDARAMLTASVREPRTRTFDLNPRPGDHGVQCCGGRVTLLLEPVVADRPVVAVFGAGHVGWALVDVLRGLPVAVEVVDSRADQLALHPLTRPGQQARIRTHGVGAPESVIADLPAGAHLVVLTHDHAEDLAVLDVALRRDAERGDLGYIGLIGSATKWSHFRRRLADAGHADGALSRVTTPIGLPGVGGKEPGAIAISVAAQLLAVLDPPRIDK